MNSLTTAERRAYHQICGANGAIMVIACDQRGGIRKLLSPDKAGEAAITDAMLGDTKIDVTRYLAAHAPSILLDPICAVPRVVDEAALPRDVALLIGLDASGYDTSPQGFYLSRLVPGVDARRECVRDRCIGVMSDCDSLHRGFIGCAREAPIFRPHEMSPALGSCLGYRKSGKPYRAQWLVRACQSSAFSGQLLRGASAG